MRNLKRVLSLALATAMLLGMMVVGASAADKKKPLTDIDTVVNKEAVNLMVDLGIIVGKPDGSFAPAETVDRATMAKLITYIMMGDVDGSLFNGTKTDLTDIGGNWAEGYIKYCYANNIITGDGTGHFFPGNKVTTVQAAKMLLVALGYDANTQGYVGNNWAVNIVRDAKLAGLLDGVSTSTNADLSRDAAAQMIFNALNAGTVTYEVQYDQGVAYKVNPVLAAPTLGRNQYDLVLIKGIVNGINSDGTASVAPVNDAAGNPIGNVSLITGKFAVTPDMVGSSVVAYSNSRTGKLISTVLTPGVSTILGTSTDGTAIANLTTKGDSKYIASQIAGGATVYYNGSTTPGSLVRGSIVELVDNTKSGTADVIRVTTKSVATLAAAPVVKDDTVTITSIPGLAKIDATKVFGYEDLAKGDVVLYVQLGDSFYVEKAASVTGVVSGLHSTKGILLDGSYYKDSAIGGAANIWSADYTNTYTFYLDNGKNIVKAVKDTTNTATSYAVLTDIAWVTGAGVEGTNYVEGKLLFADGTTQVVKIASIDGVTAVPNTYMPPSTEFYSSSNAKTAGDSATPVSAKNYIYTVDESTDPSNYTVTAKKFVVGTTADLTIRSGLGTITVSGTTYTASNSATSPAFASTGRFYAYSKNSAGAYVLTTTPNGFGTPGADSFDAVKASINNTGDTAVVGGSAVANAGTTFLYAVTNPDGSVKYTVYTGLANAPKATSIATTVGSIVKNSSGFASMVYVAAASGSVSGSYSADLVYITSANYTTKVANGVTYYTQSAVVNGVEKSVDLTARQAVGMYAVSDATVEGYLTLSSTLTGIADAYTGIKGNSGSVLVLGAASTPVIYTEDTVVYLINSDGTSTQMTGDSIILSAVNNVYVVTDKNDIATSIYVIEKSAAPGTLVVTGATITVNDASGNASNSTKDLRVGAVSVDGAPGTVTVTCGSAPTGVTYKVSINGGADSAAGATAAQSISVTAAMSNTTLKVKVTAIDGISGAMTVYNYTIAVGTVVAP